MSVESADENFERKRNEMKTMVGLEIAKTQKTQGFPGHWPYCDPGPHRELDASAAAQLLADASSVIIVPGYGLAVAKAQYQVAEIVALLTSQGKKVRFGVHPVAGRTSLGLS